MKSLIAGVYNSSSDQQPIPDGTYLLRVARAQLRWARQKRFYSVTLLVEAPEVWKGTGVYGEFDCGPKVLWRLNWFLRDFGYNTALLERDEIDEQRLVGLIGVVRISHEVRHGRPHANFEGFAPAAYWDTHQPNQRRKKKLASRS